MAPSTSRKARSRASSLSTHHSNGNKTRGRKTKHKNDSEDSDTEDHRDGEYAGEEDEADDSEDEDINKYDSDALDDDDFSVGTRKRKRRTSTASPQKRTKTNSPAKKNKPSRRAKTQEEDVDELELEDGQEIVGAVVQAPATGQVPPGQISQNTFDFLAKLKDPACNDRQWFKLHEPVYRQAEAEWKAFVETLTDLLVEVDPQLPPLPAKDVVHRIYRDVSSTYLNFFLAIGANALDDDFRIRFSNDKTPYKKGFSASFSRTGRKGIFAHYHVAIQPGGHSIIAAGAWCPGRNELANIRTNILNDSRRLRRVLSAPAFVKYFGEPRPRKDGGRQSVFGNEDELKTAPKGVDKEHGDIDLLKCRSFAVVHRFADEEVLAEDFKEKVAEVVRVMRPFVHCLNDMMTVNAGGVAGESEDSGEDEGGEEE
ncbi:putative conserved hypothetical protein (DUF2461) [Lyophyllum shimeji]|uniref:Uncharacterized protein n=1 Tax=Lyophyllum shimeji TaxID=47721 RepID=A0A9P3PMC1_LYOSH|nr:putative conserved hypothetical protein (DUF2461) [Lyophyllum shimeji]